jgi:hypothetical protein
MSETVTCPNCQRSVEVPAEQTGQEVHCPGCGTRFAGKTPSASAGEEAGAKGPGAGLPRWGEEWGDGGDERKGEEGAESAFDELQLRRPLGAPAAWARVRRGITLVLVGFCALVALSVVADLLLMRIDGGRVKAGGAAGGPTAAFGAAVVVGLLALHGLMTVGYGLCMAAPPVFGLRGLGIACFALQAGGLILSLLSVGANVLGGGGLQQQGLGPTTAAGALQLVSAVLGVALIFVFLCFLRGVALAWDVPWLANSVRGLMVLVGVVVAVAASFFAVAAAMGVSLLERGFQGFEGANAQVGGAAALIVGMGCLLLVGALGALIWFLMVLVQTRNVIRTDE